MKYVLRRILIPLARFEPYRNPDAVGGWSGSYSIFGRCIGFRDTEGNLCVRY